ncbi:SHOCT domain-containing protein [Sphingomonas sp. FUKUSWIS1]|uniref:SHOCT domain-containing protein n=1 Tax=Sphingomonas sp. FUKUSWIS1 TaxID=1379701 RepID=UPI0009DE4292|nr:SHOCT domain-containing protein [Sphingomonas sp. FUKUSWIS1]
MLSSQMDRLAKLNELRAAGALTEAEFDLEKRKILDGSASILLSIGKPAAVAVFVVLLVALLVAWMTRDITQVRQPVVVKVNARRPAAPVAPPLVDIKPVLPTPPPLPPVSNWAGKYKSEAGGLIGSMTLQPLPKNLFKVNISVGSPRCVGEIDFTAKSQGNLMRYIAPYDAVSQQQCSITLVRNGSKVIVEEHSCGVFHGFECSFDGTYARR